MLPRWMQTACLAGCAWWVVGSVSAESTYNIVWDSPSPDHRGSMPLGNGEIGLNAWVEPDGDLCFYIARTDSWGDNGRLLKIGKVRVVCDPPLVAPGAEFQQELDLATGTLKVRTGVDGRVRTLALWVDAHRPVIEVQLEGKEPFSATTSIEPWRIEPVILESIEVSDVLMDRSKPGNMHAPTVVEPDIVLTGLSGRIGWLHHNIKSVGPAEHAATQGVVGFERPDPLLHRTFGALVSADGGQRLDDTHLASGKGRTHRIRLVVHTEHPSTPDAWQQATEDILIATETIPAETRRRAHETWWAAFWDRSWIRATGPHLASPARLTPVNELPLRVGQDQSGGNRIQGVLSGVDLLGRVLPAREIAEAAAAGPPGKAANVDLDASCLEGPFSLTAWIKLERATAGGGRLIDNITPGQSDGFLLDTYPGKGLRLIVGERILSQPDVLVPGQWHHVVATVGADTLSLYLDGKPVVAEARAAEEDAFVVSRAYALQRFVDACAGRGRYPIKFNGSLFTVPYGGRPGDADYRRWGPGYWWQNTRLPYLSMPASGDTDHMEALFRMYVDELLPLNICRTRRYFGHEGAYYAECIHFWGDVFNESYGWTPMEERDDPLQVSGWHKWEWVAGPELVWMMLDSYAHTLDEPLLQQRILPTAEAVLAFFEQHYRVDEAGRLVMHPSQAVETWWDCTNPMPEVAGLRAVTDRLLALPETLTTPEQRRAWATFRKKLPDLPTRLIDGEHAYAPAERFEAKRNVENPELYCVFPFRLAAFNRPHPDWGIRALDHRWDKGHAGWRQDDLFMAYLGLTEQARQNLVRRARQYDKGSRFPAFWGPNYDWVPDQDHGGVLMKAFQSMLMQTEPEMGTEWDGKIYLLPAWPPEWDVDFKLHAPGKTIVRGTVRDGKVVELDVSPPSRRKDVVIVEPSIPPESSQVMPLPGKRGLRNTSSPPQHRAYLPSWKLPSPS